MKIAAVLITLSFAIAGCTVSPQTPKPIWEVMKDEEAARARTLGSDSFRPQDNLFPPPQPVWRGSRPN
ncbi:hypothetical protein GFK26_18605 [Variovorax paradoxus]|uniref:Lipoprotein n=1 Tax=Variovorax paradoxus TaxID=34073 RepID=A0A5Q0M573_VARPD|nr:hypothetical protein [Variovorax paradoxus]QFZ84639.1 hypothetical protein GFK26_18605 [Variovorax paradoxus]